MISEWDIEQYDKEDVMKRAELATADFEEKSFGDRRKLMKILQVMFYAHTSSKLRDNAREILSSIL